MTWAFAWSACARAPPHRKTSTVSSTRSVNLPARSLNQDQFFDPQATFDELANAFVVTAIEKGFNPDGTFQSFLHVAIAAPTGPIQESVTNFVS